MDNRMNSRYIFDDAGGHVYQLMKNDSYPRYLRSEMYKEYLNGTKKKVSGRGAFCPPIPMPMTMELQCSS